MAKKFLGAKNLQLKGKAGQNAPPEVRLAHAALKQEAFNTVAAHARSIGLESHAQKSENNAGKLTGKIEHLRSLKDKSTISQEHAASAQPSLAPNSIAEPFVRILLPGIGEKVNVVA